MRRLVFLIAATMLASALLTCTTREDGTGDQAGEKVGESATPGRDGPGRDARSRRPGAGRPGASFEGAQAGVPVEVAKVERRPIALYFETQGTLEAENEVDLVARIAGPIVELAAEEGQRVAAGQLLARIDDREIRAQLEVAEVRLEETRKAYERVEELRAGELVSQESFDQALANYQSAQGDSQRIQVELSYTRITAPFAGLIVRRYVRFAEHLTAGARLFRLSDFTPLLCPIQVPERELPRLAVGQPAELAVAAWPGRRFAARLLRMSPVIDAETGTVRVTLEVAGEVGGEVGGEQRLRPGMFADVYLEMERRPEALVIPKAALALDSLGDTVFVARDGVAERRSLELGFENEERLEVLAGLQAGELVVVAGQDGLSEGTPIEILGGDRGP